MSGFALAPGSRRWCVAALLMAACLAPAASPSSVPSDPEEELYERRRKGAIVAGAFCRDDACRARAQIDRIHAEQQLQAHREAERTRATIEAAVEDLSPPPDAPAWWCFVAPSGSVGGWCDATATGCAEYLVQVSEGLTLFDARCLAQPVAYCFAGNHRTTNELAEACLPTVEICAKQRALTAKAGEWDTSPECFEVAAGSGW